MVQRPKWLARQGKIPDQGFVQASVEAAMRDLRDKWLPSGLCEVHIPMLAEKYVYMIAPDRFAPSKSGTARQLSNVKKHGNALLISMQSLQGPAIDALVFRKSTLGEFEVGLQRLIEAASHAKIPNTAKGRKGPNLKLQPRKIAEGAADDFYHLTGKPPTRVTYPKDGKTKLSVSQSPRRVTDRADEKTKLGGEFVYFLDKIFKALGVAASVDRYSAEAIRVWTNKQRS